MQIKQIIINFGGCTAFARRFGITARTARNWKSGRTELSNGQLELYRLAWDFERKDLPKAIEACRSQFKKWRGKQ